MELGQGYVMALVYPEQFAVVSVETMLSGGQEGCVLESCFYRYSGVSEGMGSRVQMLGRALKPIR